MSIKSRKGFTLVELSLSMAFIATLSVIVVVLIGNAVSAYHRGVVMNQLNTGGMDLVDDMKSTVQNSPTTVIKNMCVGRQGEKDCEADDARSFIYVEYIEDNVEVGGNKMTAPLYGAFCTGDYSYIWNSGYLFTNNDDGIKIEGKVASKVSKMGLSVGNKKINDFRLLKVRDKNRSICVNAATDTNSGYVSGNGIKAGFNGFVVDEDPQEDIVDLLAGSNLAIYDLKTEGVPAKGADGSLFYVVSFILGTVQGGINLTDSNCTEPEVDSVAENFDYCAINNFKFAALATRESNQ